MSRSSRILVVDDQENIRDDFCRILGSHAGRVEDSKLADLGESLFGDDAGADSDVGVPLLVADGHDEEYRVDTASQGQEGLEKIKAAEAENDPYAVVFLDMRMPPGWDGTRTAAEIRKVDKRVEIVIVTAYSDAERSEIVRTVGSPVSKLLYLKKPFANEEIEQLALALTTKWGLEREREAYEVSLEQLLRSLSMISGSGRDLVPLLRTTLQQVALLVGANDSLLATRSETGHQLITGTGRFSDTTDAEGFLSQIPDAALDGQDIAHHGDYLVVPLTDQRVAVVLDECRDAERYTDVLRLFLRSAAEVIENSELQLKLQGQQSMAAIGEAAGFIVHDLKNPLGAINSWVDLIQLEPHLQADPMLQEALPQIRMGAEQTLRLVDDILLFAKSQSSEVASEPVVLAELVHQLKGLLAQSLRQAEVSMQVEVPEDFVVLGDSGRIYRVLSNLVKNALEAMAGQGDGVISVRAQTRNGIALVEVADNGPGIPADLRPSVFDAFRSEGKATGTGLGMAIVKRFVADHDGEVSFESSTADEVGAGKTGTTFRFDLPVAAPTSTPTPSSVG